jgi:hypothetical protein
VRGDRGPRGGNSSISRELVSPMHLHLFIPLFYIYYIYCHSHSIPSHPTVQSFGLLLQITVIDTYKHRLAHSHALNINSFSPLFFFFFFYLARKHKCKLWFVLGRREIKTLQLQRVVAFSPSTNL